MADVKNGNLVYATLVQYSTLTGQPTGVTKPNNSSDPDYVPPVYNTTACTPGTSGSTPNP